MNIRARYEDVMAHINSNRSLDIEGKRLLTEATEKAFGALIHVKFKKEDGFYEGKPYLYDEELNDALALWRGYLVLATEICGPRISPQIKVYMKTLRKLEREYFLT